MELDILCVCGLRSSIGKFDVLIIGVDTTCATNTTQAVGCYRLLLIGVAIEHIIVSYNILVLEVEHKCWIESYTAEACLEVQV